MPCCSEVHLQRQYFPNCCATGKCDNRTTRSIKLSTHPKWINKENSRSEIWHYSAYKTDDKGERTDLTAAVCKRCYKSCVFATGGNTSNLFKHLSLAHPDLTGECIIHNSDLTWTFIHSWSTHIQMWYSKLIRACVLEPVKFWSRNICTCISYNWILTELELSNFAN